MLNLDEIRPVLARLVGSICPAWLAADKDDIVQNACMRLMKITAEAEKSSEFSTSYLWKTAHSAVMDEIRSRTRHPVVPEEEGESVASPESGPEEGRAEREIGEEILAGLRKLNAPRRRAVALYLFGYSLAESAGILGWDTKKLANMRYRGLDELREWLENRGVRP